jgi:hypothetical protein
LKEKCQQLVTIIRITVLTTALIEDIQIFVFLLCAFRIFACASGSRRIKSEAAPFVTLFYSATSLPAAAMYTVLLRFTYKILMI